MSRTHRETQVTAASAGRVDLVVRSLTGQSRAQVRGLIQQGGVRINGRVCASDFDRVAAGDTVAVVFDAATRYAARRPPSAAAPFQILFEDEHLLVVEKAAHLLTVPTPKREPHTLVHLLQDYVSRGRRHRGRVEIVHRLDRGVSGVLVFAKTPAVAAALRTQFAAAKPEREYVALVAGRLSADRGTFDQWLVTDEHTIHRRVAPRPGVGERAVTHYTVERRLADATRIRVRLETGRRNQIRVHFATAGHPVLGDPRYGGDAARHRRWPHRRLALHAATLGFTHPVTGAPLRFVSREPREFAAFAAGN